MVSGPCMLVSCAAIQLTPRTRIQMTKLTEGMSYPRYMELYTVAYNYCTSSRMNAPSDTALGGQGHRGE